MAVFVIMRFALRRAHISVRQYILISTVTALAVVLIILGLTGRVPWIAAVAGAILPFLGRIAGFLRLLPLLRFLSGATGWPGGLGSGQASAGNQSRVQTRFITMVLDHDSGRMDGEVLEGAHRGRMLSSLELPDLMQLLAECAGDPDSANVLQAYLDRHHDEWRQHADGHGAHDASGRGASGRGASGRADQGTMSEKHALEILGLEQGASRDEIVDAHRKLMQKLHPDRGGSTYLAAKINEAKEFLLEKER